MCFSVRPHLEWHAGGGEPLRIAAMIVVRVGDDHTLRPVRRDPCHEFRPGVIKRRVDHHATNGVGAHLIAGRAAPPAGEDEALHVVVLFDH